MREQVKRGVVDDENVLLVSVSGPGCLDAFQAFLRDVHVHASVVGDSRVEVSIPGALTELHERRELIGYLTTFNALHPGCSVEPVD